MQAKCLALSLPLAFALAAAGVPALAKADKEHHGGVKLSAALSGANEVDAQGAANKGDPDGTGSFSGRIVPGQGQLCYTLTWSGVDTPTMAHIHSGAVGVNGPVFIGLAELAPGEHCIAVDQGKATALVAKPQDFYANIHNPAFPGGALRGQLVKN